MIAIASFLAGACRADAERAEIGDAVDRTAELERRVAALERKLEHASRASSTDEPEQKGSLAETAREATEEARRHAHDLELPKAASGAMEPIDAVLVVIDAAGGISVNGSPVTADDLVDHLRTTFDRMGDTKIVIQADARVPHKDVVAAIDATKQAGFTKFAIAVGSESAVEAPAPPP